MDNETDKIHTQLNLAYIYIYVCVCVSVCVCVYLQISISVFMGSDKSNFSYMNKKKVETFLIGINLCKGKLYLRRPFTQIYLSKLPQPSCYSLEKN